MDNSTIKMVKLDTAKELYTTLITNLYHYPYYRIGGGKENE